MEYWQFFLIVFSASLLSAIAVVFYLHNFTQRTPQEKLFDKCGVPRGYTIPVIRKEDLESIHRADQNARIRVNFSDSYSDKLAELSKNVNSLYNEMIKTVRKADWLLIEQAPKDGTVVLLVNNRDYKDPNVSNLRLPMFGCWRHDVCSWVCFSRNPSDFSKQIFNYEPIMKCNPTHFLPIPPV